MPALDGLRIVCVAAITISLLLPLASAIGLAGLPVIGKLVSATWIGFDALFVLSGLLLARTWPTFVTPGDLARWWGRRLLRIYPVYIASLLLLLLLGLTSWGAKSDIGAVVRGVVLVSAVEPSFANALWGVSVLWLGILLAPLLLIGLHSLRAMPGVLAAVGVVLLAVVMVVLTSASTAPTWGFGAYARGLAEFTIGAIAWTVVRTLLADASRSRVIRLGNALALFGAVLFIVAVAAGMDPGWLLPAVVALVVGASLGRRNVVAVLVALRGGGEAAYATFGAASVICAAAVGLTADWVGAAGIAAVAVTALVLVAGLGIALWRVVDRPIQDRLDSPTHLA